MAYKISKGLAYIITPYTITSLTITLMQKPREVSLSRRRTDSLCLVILRRLRETPLGFCLRVIVHEFHPNIAKTTSSVLSVIFINPWFKHYFYSQPQIKKNF